MSRKISSDKDKIELINSLIKENRISFEEGLKLLEVEKEYVNIPYVYPYYRWPYNNLPGIYTPTITGVSQTTTGITSINGSGVPSSTLAKIQN